MSEENKKEEMDSNGEKYSLYTEHIAPNSYAKIKKLMVKGCYFMAMAVFFGLVAGLVMIIVYKTGNTITRNEPNTESVTLSGSETSSTNPTSKEPVTITTSESHETETTTQEQLEWNDTIRKELTDVKNTYNALKNVAARVNQSSVTVTVAQDGVDWFNSSYQSVSSEYGIIVSMDTDHYYILTDYSLVSKSGKIYVTYGDGSEKTAELMAGDATTGYAVVKAGKVKTDSVKPAVLADSATVKQGDVLVAVGKLYGFVDSMGYGIATGINNTVSDTDSAFSLITTNITGTETSTGIIANLNGDIVGIITTGYNTGTSNLVSAYSMEGLHERIENLINGNKTPYFGIKAQDVTDKIKDAYGLPAGIYVSAVETNSPAYNAGIQTGDIITSVNGSKITSVSDFSTVLHSLVSGDATEVKVQRKGRDAYKEIVFTITLGVE